MRNSGGFVVGAYEFFMGIIIAAIAAAAQNPSAAGDPSQKTANENVVEAAALAGLLTGACTASIVVFSWLCASCCLNKKSRAGELLLCGLPIYNVCMYGIQAGLMSTFSSSFIDEKSLPPQGEASAASANAPVIIDGASATEVFHAFLIASAIHRVLPVFVCSMLMIGSGCGNTALQDRSDFFEQRSNGRHVMHYPDAPVVEVANMRTVQSQP